MFFEFSPPTRIPEGKVVKKQEIVEDFDVLVLGPFTKLPKILFENIKIGDTAVRSLVVKNPGTEKLYLSVRDDAPADLHIALNWTQMSVDPKQEIVLKLTWTATVEGSWFQTFRLNYGFKKDVSISVVLKSINTSKGQKKKKLATRRIVQPTKNPRPVLPDITNFGSSTRVEQLWDSCKAQTGDENRRETYILTDIPVRNLGNVEDKIQSATLWSGSKNSPLTSPNPRYFQPKISSTEEKQQTCPKYEGNPRCLLPDFVLNTTPDTQLHNISAETYVKLNLSSETYIKDERFERSSLLPSISPLKPAVKVNDWDLSKAVRPSTIIEEVGDSFISQSTPSGVKRKSDLTINTVPIKRPNLTWSRFGIDPRKKIPEFKDLYLLSPEDFHPHHLYHYLNNAECLKKMEDDFLKSLNALLLPSKFVNLDQDNPTLNIKKLLMESKKNTVENGVKDEMVSVNIAAIESLRKKAVEVVKSECIQEVFQKITWAVNENKLSIREDRNIHLDLNLKSEITAILLSYNRIWFRTAIQVVYNTKATLNSDDEITTFLLDKFFSHPGLIKKYKSMHAPKYKIEIKKFLLKKFLMLVYFLDYIKMMKLIPHDPCLFRRTAPIKDSRQALLIFSKEVLFAVGDITRQLKHMGYVVFYKQTYIDEFQYKVNALAHDLRDGVRLTRLLEIILCRRDLITTLRVPAISRLQKVHNVKVVLRALNAAGYEILFDIEAEDIVDGHREKTFSFLWQILYKFQAPLMMQSATIIQTWWRSEQVTVKRDALRAVYLRKKNAAVRICFWYKHILFMRKYTRFLHCLELWREINRRNKAAVLIQKNIRMCLQLKRYRKLQWCVTRIQSYARRWLVNNSVKKQITAAVKIQRYMRAYWAMKTVRAEFLEQKTAAIIIQQFYRNMKLTRVEHAKFLAYKTAALTIQQRFSAFLLMRTERSYYMLLREKVIFIQHKFRATRLMKLERERYQNLKWAALVVQKHYRSLVTMRVVRGKFLTLKRATTVVQHRFREKILARQIALAEYIRQCTAAITIQRWYRSLIAMRVVKEEFLTLKRTAVFVQRQFIAKMLRRQAETQYTSLKTKTIFIQRRFRANKARQLALTEFTKQRSAVLTIQSFYRRLLIMRLVRAEYLTLKRVTTSVQRRFRANNARKLALTVFTRQRSAVITIQRWYRSLVMMRLVRTEFLTLKRVTTTVQRRLRANNARNLALSEFTKQRSAVVTLQGWYRSLLAMRVVRAEYQTLKRVTTTVQHRLRANNARKLALTEFTRQRGAVITIQRWYRSLVMMRVVRAEYQTLKRVTTTVQRRLRANNARKIALTEFTRQRGAVIIIQRWYRSLVLMRLVRADYLMLKRVTTSVQRRFRANNARTLALTEFTRQRSSIITIQRWYRAIVLRRRVHLDYVQLKATTIFVQRKFRANKARDVALTNYHKQRNSAIKIQNFYKAYTARQQFFKLKYNAICIQRLVRANKLRKEAMKNYQVLLEEKRKRDHEALVQVTRLVQRKFRALKAGRVERERYLKIVSSTTKIQMWWRAIVETRASQTKFLIVTQAAITIQRTYRRWRLVQAEVRRMFELKNKAATIIQAVYRSYRARVEYPEVTQIRARLRNSAGSYSEANTTGAVFRRLLECIIDDASWTLMEGSNLLKQIDLSTRCHKESCLSSKESLPPIMYNIITSSNRAPDEVDFSTLATNILINISKCPGCIDYIWDSKAIEGVITVMVHFCDKEYQLFTTLCTLVWLFAQNPVYRHEIKETEHFHRKMSKIGELCKRKVKMMSNSQKVCVLFNSTYKKVLPSVKSDWGLSYTNKIYTFTNSLQAYNALMSLFNLT